MVKNQPWARNRLRLIYFSKCGQGWKIGLRFNCPVVPGFLLNAVGPWRFLTAYFEIGTEARANEGIGPYERWGQGEQWKRNQGT